MQLLDEQYRPCDSYAGRLPLSYFRPVGSLTVSTEQYLDSFTLCFQTNFSPSDHQANKKEAVDSSDKVAEQLRQFEEKLSSIRVWKIPLRALSLY